MVQDRETGPGRMGSWKNEESTGCSRWASLEKRKVIVNKMGSSEWGL